MRRPIRPFVKEYKTRSTKTPRVATEDAALEPTPRFLEPTPRFLDAPPPPPQRPREPDDSYEAAMRAADLVFGKKAPASAPSPVETLAPQPAMAGGEVLVAEAAPAEAPRPTGRILPSLVEIDLAPLDEPEPPPRKRGRPRKIAVLPPVVADEPAAAAPESAAVAEPKRKRGRPASVAAPRPIFVADPDIEDALEEIEDALEDDEDLVDAPPRAMRRIQARWVRRTELMAGEKWRRRLPQPSRTR